MIKKKIALALLVSTLSVSALQVSAAPVDKGVTSQKGKPVPVLYNSKKDKEKDNKDENKLPYSYAVGKVVEVSEVKGGLSVLVQVKDTEDPRMGQLRLIVSDETEICDVKGKKLSAKDIKEGMYLKAAYGPAVTMSIPPMSAAKKVILYDGSKHEDKKQYKDVEGKVTSFMKYKDGLLASIKTEKGEFLSYISKNVKIINDEGKKLNISDISENVKVKLTIHQKYAARLGKEFQIVETDQVIVMNNKDESSKEHDRIVIADAASYSGIIEDVSKYDGKISITIKKLDKSLRGQERIVFHVNEDTQINTKNMEDLKEGAKVEVLYNGILTRSLPGQGTAMAVNVIEEAENAKDHPKLQVADAVLYTGKIEDIKKYDGKTSITVKKPADSNLTQERIVFHIDENTRINTENFNDLVVGADVEVYYSGKLTKSIPPQGTAIAINVCK